MRVKYIYESKSRIIQEEMYQVNDEYGQYLAGKNPFDTYTGQPLSSYLPDNVIMEDDLVYVFDDNYTYETQLVEITDVNAILRAFNFTDADIDF